MSTFHYRNAHDYHTPEKIIRPDATKNSYLKSTTPPTIEPSKFSTSSKNQNHVYLGVHRDSSPAPRFSTQYVENEQDIHSVLSAYELKINLLKTYLHSSDDIQRQKIVDIFGFEYPCCRKGSAQSKIVLKELSSKVKDLIRENSRLKQSREYVFTSKAEKSDDQLLLAENQKLRMMIDEYRRNQNSSSEKLTSENYMLRRQNEELRPLKRQNEELRNRLSQKSNLAPQPGYSSEDIQFVKKELTKQMFEFSQQLQRRNKINDSKVNGLEQRLIGLDSKIKNYERERKIKVDSTIRKSFVLSQSMVRPMGDPGNDTLNKQEIPFVKESMFVSQVRPMRTSLPAPVNSNKLTNLENPPNNTLTAENNGLRDKISMQEMKIKNLMEQNSFLKNQISQLNGKLHGKVERIITLQEHLNSIERDQQNYVRKKTVVNPEFENEVRIIKDTLLSCNISNFNQFFQEFNEIIRQRNQVKSHLEGLSASRIKRREDTSIVDKKIYDLTEENKTLLKKIGELEAEVENYHSEVITNQIEKLNTIQLSKQIRQIMPTGKQAIQWQYKVKACIQNSVNRLQILEKKIGEKKINTMTEFDRRGTIEEVQMKK